MNYRLRYPDVIVSFLRDNIHGHLLGNMDMLLMSLGPADGSDHRARGEGTRPRPRRDAYRQGEKRKDSFHHEVRVVVVVEADLCETSDNTVKDRT
jgi:hypothetical protein